MSEPAKVIIEKKDTSVPLRSLLPVLAGLIFLTGSLAAILYQTLRSRSYHETWRSYDDPGNA